MSLLKREQANASNSALCSYSSPIVHALSKLPDLEKAQLCVTFDLANFIARVVSDQMLRMADRIGWTYCPTNFLGLFLTLSAIRNNELAAHAQLDYTRLVKHRDEWRC